MAEHAWGRSHQVYAKDDRRIVLARSNGIPACSSVHYHEDQANEIVVIEGSVTVLVYGDDEPVTVCPLLTGGKIHLPAKRLHQLVFGSRPTTLVEAYRADDPLGCPAESDIVRISTGHTL